MGRTEQVTVHQNLVLVRAPDKARLDELLARSDVRNRLVRRLDERTMLISRAGLVALRKGAAAIGLPEVLETHEVGHGRS